MGAISEPSRRSPEPRQLQALARWLACGAVVGALFGAAYALLWIAFSDEADARLMLLGLTVAIAATGGAAFAGWQHARSSQECSLGTMIGFFSGVIPALVISVAAVDVLHVVRRPVTLAGLALVPAMAGFLIGGLLDRFVEPLLFVAPTERGDDV